MRPTRTSVSALADHARRARSVNSGIRSRTVSTDRFELAAALQAKILLPGLAESFGLPSASQVVGTYALALPSRIRDPVAIPDRT